MLLRRGPIGKDQMSADKQTSSPLAFAHPPVLTKRDLVVLGQQVLEHIGDVFASLSDLVVAHHERWDGKGYPHALVGAAIPLGARILAVVDSYDAVTSERPYRHALSEQEATDELRRGAGSQYDPHVVEAFLQVCEKQGVLIESPPRRSAQGEESTP